VSLGCASRGRYRRRSGAAWAGFLRASAGSRNGTAEPVYRTNVRARHKTRNTTDIRESCARLGVSRPTENGAFCCSKKAAPFSVACGAIFHNLLKQQKIAPGLDTESARNTIKDRLCCAIKRYLPLLPTAKRYTLRWRVRCSGSVALRD